METKYRILKVGEVIKEGDQYLSKAGVWITTGDPGKVVRSNGYQYRRPVEVMEEPRFVASDRDTGQGLIKTYRIDDTSWQSKIKVFDGSPNLRDHIVTLLNKYPMPPVPDPFDWDSFWKGIPVWMNWVALDGNSQWYASSDEPHIEDGDDYWYVENGGSLLIPEDYSPPLCDWETSKIKRP